MFHLLVKASGWKLTEDTLGSDRVFEHTEEFLVDRFKPTGQLNLPEIYSLPAIFMPEVGGDEDQLARIGYIQKISKVGKDFKIRYIYDPEVSPIHNEDLKSIATELDISSFEFHRTHWSVKDVDLFKILHTKHVSRSPSPKIFSFDDLNRPDEDLISAMMPFDGSFTRVYDALKSLTTELGMKCLRADDLWENEAVMDDVVSLICRSRIVICDCTGRNPNVFYEAGIAHSLGKDVILITQNAADIPFDLRHLRYVTYLNNGEGLSKLTSDLRSKIQQLSGL